MVPQRSKTQKVSVTSDKNLMQPQFRTRNFQTSEPEPKFEFRTDFYNKFAVFNAVLCFFRTSPGAKFSFSKRKLFELRLSRCTIEKSANREFIGLTF